MNPRTRDGGVPPADLRIHRPSRPSRPSHPRRDLRWDGRCPGTVLGRRADPMGLEVLTGERTQHRYQTCEDELCQRYACRVYKEGYRNGREQGRAEGRAEGEAIGYSRGYSAGAASCGDR